MVGGRWRTGDAEAAVVGVPDNEVRKMLSDNFLSPDNVVLEQNSPIVNTGDRLMQMGLLHEGDVQRLMNEAKDRLNAIEDQVLTEPEPTGERLLQHLARALDTPICLIARLDEHGSA